jgi:hypothetical protein
MITTLEVEADFRRAPARWRSAGRRRWFNARLEGAFTTSLGERRYKVQLNVSR